MKFLESKTKKELLEEIDSTVNRTDNEIYLPLRPTVEIINKLLQKNPDIKKIQCPQSLYLQVSKKAFKKLRELGIEIQPGDIRVGRPLKHDINLIRRVINEKAKGKPVKQISEENGIPVRTIYYYLKNGVKE